MTTYGSEMYYWKKNPDWYKRNEKTLLTELTPLAPERAVESFKLWKEHKKKYL